jgi:hypothetical protein
MWVRRFREQVLLRSIAYEVGLSFALICGQCMHADVLVVNFVTCQRRTLWYRLLGTLLVVDYFSGGRVFERGRFDRSGFAGELEIDYGFVHQACTSLHIPPNCLSRMWCRYSYFGQLAVNASQAGLVQAEAGEI